MKLSKVQVDVLRKLADGGRIEWVPGPGWCFISPINHGVINVLRQKGVINTNKASFKDILTPLGRKTLEEQK